MKNINDYKNTVSRMHAGSEFDFSGIESGTEKRNLSGKSFFPAIAVAATLAIGTAGAAATNFDWIRSFFHKDIFISEDVEALAANFDNYECFSNCGIDMSLDGIIADEQSIYCQFTINEAPEGYDPGKLVIGEIASKSFNIFGDNNERASTAGSQIKDGNKLILTMSSDTACLSKNDSIAIHLYNEDYAVRSHSIYDLNDWKVYPYDLMTKENLENNGTDYVLIKFDLNLNDNPSVKIDKGDLATDSPYDSIEITPFKMISNSVIFDDSHEPDFLKKHVRLLLEDGREIISGDISFGDHGLSAVDKTDTSDGFMVHEGKQMWEFGEPINPESVKEIYVGDQLIYKK